MGKNKTKREKQNVATTTPPSSRAAEALAFLVSLPPLLPPTVQGLVDEAAGEEGNEDFPAPTLGFSVLCSSFNVPCVMSLLCLSVIGKKYHPVSYWRQIIPCLPFIVSISGVSLTTGQRYFI